MRGTLGEHADEDVPETFHARVRQEYGLACYSQTIDYKYIYKYSHAPLLPSRRIITTVMQSAVIMPNRATKSLESCRFQTGCSKSLKKPKR